MVFSIHWWTGCTYCRQLEDDWTVFARISAVRGLPAVAGALVLLAAAPALAQSAASRIDQPTPGTLPPGISTTPGGASPSGNEATGQVAPPNAIQSTTDVMDSSTTVQGADGARQTNPLQHLPRDMR